MVDVPLRSGAIIDDRFTLRRQLGSGGCGVVWLASDAAAQQSDVVLKILHSHFDRYSIGIRQLEREAELLAQLAHPNIAKPLIFSTQGPHTYLAMEFIEGRSLDQEIGVHSRSDTHFPYREVSRFFEELCSAVSHAHSRTIIHRDLKPQNIMIARRGGMIFVKVLDFGIAKLLEGNVFDATTFGRRLGSIFYMSPEQTNGEPADVRSDVFALGVILYEVLTLKRAWAWDPAGRPLKAFDTPVRADGANALSTVLLRIATAPRPRPSAMRPGLSPGFDEVVTRAMAIDANDRFPSVDALLVGFRRASPGLLAAEKGTEIVDVRELAQAAGLPVPNADMSDTRLEPLIERDALVGGVAERSAEGIWRVGGVSREIDRLAVAQMPPSLLREPELDMVRTATMKQVQVSDEEEIEEPPPDFDGQPDTSMRHRTVRESNDTGPMKASHDPAGEDDFLGHRTIPVAQRARDRDDRRDDPRETLELEALRVADDQSATALSEVVEGHDFETALAERLEESGPGATDRMDGLDEPRDAPLAGRLLPWDRTPVQAGFRAIDAPLAPPGPGGGSGGGASFSTVPTETVWKTIASTAYRYRFLILSALSLVLAFAVGLAIARWTGGKGKGGGTVPPAQAEPRRAR